jgi:MFS family permease
MKADAPLEKAELFRVMAGLCLAMLLSALDQTIVVTALPTIGVELGDLKASPWIVTAYLVAATIVTPLYGKLADIHGGRIMLMVGIAVFIVGSAACALAPNMILLAGARALQGMGGGGLISLAQTIIADLVSPRERGRYQTYFAAVFVTSSVAGPLLGGLFAHYLHWSLIFWINLPLGLLAFFFANTALKRLPSRRHPHKLDYLGAGLLALASGLLALALSQRGAPLGSMLGPLALSTLFWALFAWRLRSAEEPFIPLSVLSDAVARNAALSGAFGLGAFVGLSVVMPVYFEGRLGLSADGSGLALIPMMVGTVAGATLSGRSMGHLAHYKTPAMIGLALAGAAALILAWRLVDLSLWSLIALLTLASFGVGTMLPISTVCVQNSVEIRNLGSATAVMQFVRQIGCALIVALLGALVMGDGASLDAATLGGAARNIGGATLDGAAKHVGGAAALEGLGASFHLVFIVIAICLGASLLFLVRMEEKPLRGTPAAPRPVQP